MSEDNTTNTNPPEWLEEVIEAIGITDGVDLVKWHQDKAGDYIVEIEYGEEEMSFTAGTDGESHGVQYDGSIHDMTDPSDVQWWCAGELYMRLQKAKRRIEDCAVMSENQNKQAEMHALIYRLASWSARWPRNVIHSAKMQELMDGELIEIESWAKRLVDCQDAEHSNSHPDKML